MKYWSFEPSQKAENEDEDAAKAKEKAATLKQERSVNVADAHKDSKVPRGYTGPNVTSGVAETKQAMNEDSQDEIKKPEKLVPVIFFDEAHRLPLLIRDRKAMKCILDAMLVLTKQVETAYLRRPAFIAHKRFHRTA